jgi:hypothetical protein
MSDEMRITVELEDVGQGRPMVTPARRTVRVEMELPTGEGSEGPGLEGDGWEDRVSTLAQRVVTSANFALGLSTEAERVLDRAVDKAHQRIDAIEAEVSALAADLVREDADLGKRIDAIRLVARGLAALDSEGDNAPA